MRHPFARHPFSFFKDEELAALAPAIDTFSADVAAGREPQTTIVHAYNCEVGHRKNRRLLVERDAARALASGDADRANRIMDEKPQPVGPDPRKPETSDGHARAR